MLGRDDGTAARGMRGSRNGPRSIARSFSSLRGQADVWSDSRSRRESARTEVSYSAIKRARPKQRASGKPNATHPVGDAGLGHSDPPCANNKGARTFMQQLPNPIRERYGRRQRSDNFNLVAGTNLKSRYFTPCLSALAGVPQHCSRCALNHIFWTVSATRSAGTYQVRRTKMAHVILASCFLRHEAKVTKQYPAPLSRQRLHRRGSLKASSVRYSTGSHRQSLTRPSD
jgi:hypothetical protein